MQMPQPLHWWRSIILVFSVFFSIFVRLAAAEKIRVGFSGALTGTGATYGTDIRNVVFFANDYFAQPFEFVVEDDKCNGKDAAAAAHKLVNSDKLRYVLGFTCSGAMLAGVPVFEQNRVVAIGITTSAPALSGAGRYIFRTWPSDSKAAAVLYKRMAERHRKIGVLTEQTEYSQQFLQAITGYAARDGIEVINENFSSESADVRSQLLRLRSNGIEGLFINSQAEGGLFNATKQVFESRLEIPRYGAYHPGAPAFIARAGKMAEGFEFVDAPHVRKVLGEEGKHLLDQYEKRFGQIQTLSMIFVTAFEAVRALVEASKSNEDTAQFLRTRTFSGLSGKWRFDENGDIEGISFVMKRIRNGKVEE